MHAYSDPRGVTAQFNLNLVHRINRRACGGFPGETLRAQGVLRTDHGPHREHPGEPVLAVRARRRAGGSISRPGETIHTEISCKYSIAEFQELGKRAGFTPDKSLDRSGELFSVHGMVAA